MDVPVGGSRLCVKLSCQTLKCFNNRREVGKVSSANKIF